MTTVAQKFVAEARKKASSGLSGLRAVQSAANTAAQSKASNVPSSGSGGKVGSGSKASTGNVTPKHVTTQASTPAPRAPPPQSGGGIFKHSFWSGAGQAERLRNAGATIWAAVTGRGVSANIQNPTLRRGLELAASNPFITAGVATGGAMVIRHAPGIAASLPKWGVPATAGAAAGGYGLRSLAIAGGAGLLAGTLMRGEQGPPQITDQRQTTTTSTWAPQTTTTKADQFTTYRIQNSPGSQISGSPSMDTRVSPSQEFPFGINPQQSASQTSLGGIPTIALLAVAAVLLLRKG